MEAMEVLTEYEWTWARHQGRISIAAPILGMTPEALSRALYRLKNKGYEIRMTNDIKGTQQ
jgi:muramoyltetrapeptide carboxypeptidase LdcA involved in peptidoglycan recycling